MYVERAMLEIKAKSVITCKMFLAFAELNLYLKKYLSCTAIFSEKPE
jgi:hypothetical protein